MSILVIVFFAIVTIAIGRYIYTTWFNPIGFYSTIWGFILILFEMKLIKYYSLEFETWLVIFSSWITFVIGALTVCFLYPQKKVRTNEQVGKVFSVVDIDTRYLKNVLWVLNIVALVAALYNLYLMAKLSGGLLNAFIIGNLVYSYRVAEGIPGSIPYLGSLVYTAAILAGVYTAKMQKFSLVSFMPIINIIIVDFTIMGRADILIVAIIFSTTYFMTPKQTNIQRSRVRIRKLILFAVLLSVIIGGAELIRSTRNVKEGLRGSSEPLKKLSSSTFITPTIYLYFSSSIGVLNQYLLHDGENTEIGAHTFLAPYRILERLGVDVHAKIYQKWYRVPTYVNTGTYLRELHGDFGTIGLLLGPYLLGIAISFFWLRFKRRGSFFDLSMSAFLFGIVGMSFIVIITRLGGYFFFPFIALTIAIFLDIKSKAIQISKKSIFRSEKLSP